MTRWILLLGVCVAVPIGFAIFSDRAPREFHDRITSWPFRTMPTTNGAIIGILFVGGMAMLLYLVGIIIGAKVGALG